MGTDHDTPDPHAQALLGVLAPVIAYEAQMPPSVSEAAKALFDWARVDAVLAEMAPEPVTTRSQTVPRVWRAGGLQVRVDVEPVGYRRRRLAVLVTPPETAAAMTVEVQQVDGTTEPARRDVLGDHVVEVGAGAVRLIARSAELTVTTPWFQI